MRANYIEHDVDIVVDELNKLPVPDVLPVLAVQSMVAFPFNAVRIVLPGKHKQIIDDAMQANRLIGLFGQVDEGSGSDGTMATLGSAVRIASINPLPDGTALVSGVAYKRIRLLQVLTEKPYRTARVEYAPEHIKDEIDTEALRRKLEVMALQAIELSPQLPDELAELVHNIKTPLQLCYLLAGNLKMTPDQRQAILDYDDVASKMRDLVEIFSNELEVLKVGKSIDSKVKDKLDKRQREFYLRERLEAIKKELGEGTEGEQQSDADEYKQRLAESGMSDEARKEAERELQRWSSMPPTAPDYSMIKNYLDWLLDLPWQAQSEDNGDIGRAREVLDRDHFGIESVKERIIEYLAVHEQLRERRPKDDDAGTMTGANRVILCLAGPPGTGKTSLGKSIAEALGRKYTRMSLGGIRDEAEIRGHRRTYIGAMPGRIIQALKRAGTRNPVFVLDEIDKVGTDWRGDPSSALLEVLDPEQNANFRDLYLDVDFDLSDVMFIATANQLDTIPAPLRDRMDIIQLEGYTDHEKFEIARRHLIPRQRQAHGLENDEMTITDESLRKLISDYTREAGVRNLERLVGAVCRKSIVSIKESKQSAITVDEAQLLRMLKKERFEREPTEQIRVPGIATGLAVTPVGGEILYIEATRMPGKGRLELTGQLGNVMQESARIAFSYVRSRAEALGVDPKLFETSDIHLHIPAGALPKDGPSAGVAMAMAVAGIFTDRVVPSDLGLTGEITLRGRVLPVGGIKSKVLAAHRAGLTRVILPVRNKRDEEDLPEDVRKAMTFIWVETVEDVIAGVFGDHPVSTTTTPAPQNDRYKGQAADTQTSPDAVTV